ncbi:MAG TPA: glycosyltransferase [Chitinophagaceae bacterium]|jgi:GT2 family glycosyltransferase|nr:glycosyltransferase [Chitinophagaceae bacterium]
MISLIVCSIDDRLYEGFERSVAATIGVAYEIVRVDNRIENKDLAAVYNKGAALAKYDHLLFVHEDVTFHTNNWGQILLQYFNDLPKPGIIGIMGSDYISYVANGWYVRDQSRIFAHLVQRYKYVKKEEVAINIHSQSVKPVFTVDGVFMAVKKEVWEKHRFDENVKGFHGYDLSFSLNVSATHQNYFVPGITITHFSEGKFDAQWFRNNLSIRERLFPSLTYLREKNQLQPAIERLLFFESLQNINRLDISKKEKQALRKEYIKWAKQWLGTPRLWFELLKLRLIG